MLTLDGSHGEGGGQLLRTALSLSCITSTPVRIEKIRAGRSKPGLSAQHLACVELVSRMCGAEVRGVKIGSTELEFEPGPIEPGDYSVDVRTAGSVTLIAQCVLPVALHAPGDVTVGLSGGTDVRWSPPSDYMTGVFAPAARMFNVDFDYAVTRRGYYPQGGGAAVLNCSPSRLTATEITEMSCCGVEGVCHSSNLPEHVCRRMAEAAHREICDNIKTRFDCSNGCVSTGCGITLWNGYAGADACGERGVTAEAVGKRAAMALKKIVCAPGAVDSRLADQLVLYMALAGGRSMITTCEITGHTRTNCWVCEQLLGVEFELVEGETAEISTPGLR